MNPGDQIHAGGNDYLVREVILEGGKSQAYRATCESEELFLKRLIGSVYPIKQGGHSAEKYRKLLAAADAFESRHREIMDRIKEPIIGGGNLVKPLDMFRWRGGFYKTYPFVVGDGCKSIAELSPEQKLLFTKTLLLCVRELHIKNVVHSDLKPDNVLVEERGVRVAKLIDFDDAYISGDPPRRMSGDPVYYSPEQLDYIERDGEPAAMTTKSDIFSLAIVLTVICTGDYPKASAGSGDSLAEKVSTGGVAERGRFTGLPSGLADAVHECLRPDPSDRPTIDQLVAESGISLDSHATAPDDGATTSARAPIAIEDNFGRRLRRET